MLVQNLPGEGWSQFWEVLGLEHDDESVPEGYEILQNEVEFKEILPRLYKVGLGMGYLELPQVELPGNKLTKDLLITKNVFILDCFYDVFVWIGRKSTRLVQLFVLYV